MALLIYLLPKINQAIVVKDKVDDVLKEMAAKPDLIVLNGWHGKKVIIVNPIETICHIVEEDDREMKRKQEEAKKAQQEVEMKASGGRRLVDPLMMIPGGKGRHSQ